MRLSRIYPEFYACLLQEHWSNQDEFPPTFIRGAANGFWWAYVSMTTVGYVNYCHKFQNIMLQMLRFLDLYCVDMVIKQQEQYQDVFLP